MKALLAAVVLSAIVACGGTEQATLVTSAPSEPALVVTDDDRTLPAACRPRAVGGLLLNFLAALDRGDRKAIRHYWPEQGMHGLRRRLELREVTVGYANGLGQLEVRLTRDGAEVTGKGALDCDKGRLVILGVGEAEGGRICPVPTHHTSSAVACVRHWG